jgi:hypothetical protein
VWGGGFAAENSTGLEVPDAEKHGILNVAAGHFHEITLLMFFFDQWA